MEVRKSAGWKEADLQRKDEINLFGLFVVIQAIGMYEFKSWASDSV